MKYCTHCGKELLDEAVICPGCGCVAESKKIINEPKVSTFKRNRAQWINALTIAFLVFVVATVLILTSPGFSKADQRYRYHHGETNKLSAFASIEERIEWEIESEARKQEMLPYYIGIGTCGVLALTCVAGIVLLFVDEKREKNNIYRG